MCPLSIILPKKQSKANAPFKIPSQCALSRTEAETEGDVETWVDGLTESVAARTAHVTLEQTTKCAVHDTIAFKECGAAGAGVCRIQQRDQTLVCILLCIARQRPGGAPRCGEQGCRAECGLWARRRRWCMRGCKEPVELATCAVFFGFAPSGIMLVS
jgi:hypothetical protein